MLVKLSIEEKGFLETRRHDIKTKTPARSDYRSVKPTPEEDRTEELDLSPGEFALLLRVRAQMSTREVGKKLLVGQNTVANWEKDVKGRVYRQIILFKDHCKNSEFDYAMNYFKNKGVQIEY